MSGDSSFKAPIGAPLNKARTVGNGSSRFKASKRQMQPEIPAEEVSNSTKKRKSRFSDAPPSSNAPPPTVLEVLPVPPQNPRNQSTAALADSDNKAALVSAAAAAAARINANLLAQGKIKALPNQLHSASTAPTVSISSDINNPVSSVEIKKIDDMFSAEVEINDIPVGCRNYLTRLTTQENINKSCLAYVSTRGKYMTTEEKKQHPLLMGSEKPLYLFVQSQYEGNVKKALDRIKQIINNHFEKKNKFQSEALAQIASFNPKVASISPGPAVQGFAPGYPIIQQPANAPLPHCQPALPSGNYMQEKLFIGLDNIPDNFDLKNKLIGPNYRNFTFIANQTGAKVILRGKGSGFIEPTSGREAFESMYAFISHPNQAGVDAAKRLVSNLVDTIKAELQPAMRNSVGSSQNSGYDTIQNNYRMVPPPMSLSVPNSQPVSSASSAAYPFQQLAVSAKLNPFSEAPRRKFKEYEEEPSNVLGYQHNFSGAEKGKSKSDSSKKRSSNSREKSRKRFTEDLSVTSTPSQSKSTEKPVFDDESNDNNKSDANFKRPVLPFWMTP
ncbi:KH homology domain-containing protein 4-like [Styela clava]